MKNKFLLTTILLSSLFCSAVYSQPNKWKKKKFELESFFEVGVKSDKKGEVGCMGVEGSAKIRTFKNIWTGFYGEYNPKISRIHYPYSFGITTSISNNWEGSETGLKAGISKSQENEFIPIFSLYSDMKIFKNFSLGGEINMNSDLIMGVGIFGKYSFSW